MSYVIEKDVPMPSTPVRYKTGMAATLKAMQVGDSFVSPKVGGVHAEAKRHGIRVAIRREGDGTWRVWRFA